MLPSSIPPSMPLSQLPPELLLQIFRFLLLEHQTRALCNLALVSRGIHGAAVIALYDTIILLSVEEMQKFARMALSEPAPDVLRLVRGFSPWGGDQAVLHRDGDDTEGTLCVRIILERCINIVNVQARWNGVYQLEHPPSLQSMFVWLHPVPDGDWAAQAYPAFGNLSRLHVADLQTVASRILGVDMDVARVSCVFTAENFPQLRFFSSTWAPYQMFDEEHAALRDIALAVLALPTLERFIVRHVGTSIDLPTLEELRDPRILVIAYDPHDAFLSEHLRVWSLDAWDYHSMWNGKRLWRSDVVAREHREPPQGDSWRDNITLNVSQTHIVHLSVKLRNLRRP